MRLFKIVEINKDFLGFLDKRKHYQSISYNKSLTYTHDNPGLSFKCKFVEDELKSLFTLNGEGMVLKSR